MRSFRFPLAMLLLLVLTVESATAGTVLVFLQGGQSNGDGRAYLTGLPSELQQPQTDVDFFFRVEGSHPWENQLIDLKPGSPEFSQTNYFGPEITFGRDMADYYGSDPDTSVAIIKYANGGTRLYDQWAAPSGSEYVQFQNTVDAGLAALEAAYPTDDVQIAGMIWMQGENDASSDVYANTYENNLERFIGDVRTRYGADLPFVIGRLSANQTGLSYPTGHQAVMAAQTAVADGNSRTGLVDTDSFSMKSDRVHFDAAGMQDLGSAFASVMQTTMLNDPDPHDPGDDPDPPALTGVVAHYTFDTDFSDSSGNDLHGTAYDGNANGTTDGVSITTTPGESIFGDGAASFTAERDWVQIPQQIFYSKDDYSLSFWARDLSDSSTGGMLLGTPESYPPNFFLWLWNDYVRWRGNSNEAVRQADFANTRDNDWHHYALVAGDYDEDGTVDDVTLYIDGTFVGTDPDNLTGMIIDAIGAGYGDNLDFDFEGQIDEFWILDHAITPDELELLYTSNGEVSQTLPGDLNGDGAVNSADLDLIRGNWGTTNSAGDANDDGIVNSGDLDIVRANWGATAAAATPEPSTFMLLMTLGLMTTVFSRRSRSEFRLW